MHQDLMEPWKSYFIKYGSEAGSVCTEIQLCQNPDFKTLFSEFRPAAVRPSKNCCIRIYESQGELKCSVSDWQADACDFENVQGEFDLPEATFLLKSLQLFLIPMSFIALYSGLFF